VLILARHASSGTGVWKRSDTLAQYYKSLMPDLAGPHLLKFGIESKWSCEVTSTARFKHNLAQSLRDMRRVVEAQQEGAGDVKAKL